jgi:hypothetical protein
MVRRAPVEPDIAQQALIELGELASRTAKLSSGHDDLDSNDHRTRQQRDSAAEGEGGNIGAGESPNAR